MVKYCYVSLIIPSNISHLIIEKTKQFYFKQFKQITEKTKQFYFKQFNLAKVICFHSLNVKHF